jgi:predicted amidophosphoribosyltransferase
MLLDLLLPTRCVVCRRGGPQLCAACTAALPRLRGARCERCGAPTAWPVRRCVECTGRRLAFRQARAAVVYDDAVRAVVGAWKERGLRRLTSALAELVVESLEPAVVPLTFVPSDPERRRVRGGHPAEALALALGRHWELPVLALLGRRAGERQRGLPLTARRANVRGVFSAARAPRRLILVDDVYTSGSTVNEAASALRRAGARHVDVVTFARAVRGYTVRSQA